MNHRYRHLPVVHRVGRNLFIIWVMFMMTQLITTPVSAEVVKQTDAPTWTPSAQGEIRPASQVAVHYGWPNIILGDMNGDGYDDLAVATKGMSEGGRSRLSVHLGSGDGLKEVPVWSSDGDDWSRYSKLRVFEPSEVTALGAVGDTNGDGLGDLGVIFGNELGGGQIALYAGSTREAWEEPTVLTLPPNVAAIAVDMQIISAGDVNGDGFADVAVSLADRQSLSLAIALYYGSVSGIETNARLLIDDLTIASEWVGVPVASLGDVDGDGYDDLLVGGPGGSTSTSDEGDGAGVLRVYAGSSEGPLLAPTDDITGEFDGQAIASHFAMLGDVNGDGWIEFGMAVAADLGSSFDIAIVSSNGPTVWLRAPRPGLHFGSRFFSAGDVNGDGLDDLLVSAKVEGRSAFTLWLLYLGGQLSQGGAIQPVAEWVLPYLPDGFMLRQNFAPGDLNGDGIDDLALAATEPVKLFDALHEHPAINLYYGYAEETTEKIGGATAGEAGDNNANFDGSAGSADTAGAEPQAQPDATAIDKVSALTTIFPDAALREENPADPVVQSQASDGTNFLLRIRQIEPFIERGTERAMVILDWQVADQEARYCGDCAYTNALAILVKDESEWRLDAYNSVVAASSGQIEPPTFELMTIGPNRHAILVRELAGSGSPMVEHGRILLPDAGTTLTIFDDVLREWCDACNPYETDPESGEPDPVPLSWGYETTIETVAGSHPNFYNLIVVQSGQYHYNKLYSSRRVYAVQNANQLFDLPSPDADDNQLRTVRYRLVDGTSTGLLNEESPVNVRFAPTVDSVQKEPAVLGTSINVDATDSTGKWFRLRTGGWIPIESTNGVNQNCLPIVSPSAPVGQPHLAVRTETTDGDGNKVPEVLLLNPDASAPMRFPLSEQGTDQNSTIQPTDLVHSFSPDGQWLTYYGGDISAIGAQPAADLTLYLRHIETGITEEITRLLPEEYPHNLETNLNMIVAKEPEFSEEEDLLARIWLAFTVGLKTHAWSPDGRYLAFGGAMKGPSSDLYVVDTISNEITQLTDGPQQIIEIRWSPDGRWVWHKAIDFGMCMPCPGATYVAAVDGSAVLTIPGETTDRFWGWIGPASFLQSSQQNGVGAFNLQQVKVSAHDTDAINIESIWTGRLNALAYDNAERVRLIRGTMEGAPEPNLPPSYHRWDETLGKFVPLDLPEDSSMTEAAAILAERYDNDRVNLMHLPQLRYGSGPYFEHPDLEIDPDLTIRMTGSLPLRPGIEEVEVSSILWQPDLTGFYFSNNGNLYHSHLHGDEPRLIARNAVAEGWVYLRR